MAKHTRNLGVVLGLTCLMATPLLAQEDVEHGKAVFDAVCSTCHSLEPPHKEAPPLLMIARHYVEAYGDRETAAVAMVAWATEPDAARSALPAHAIERFGLMPAQALPREDLEAVAWFALENAADMPMERDEEMMMHRSGRAPRGEQHMPHRRGTMGRP